MEPKEEALDVTGFLELLNEVMLHRDAPNGVVSARIHVRDGKLWATSVRFDDAEDKAAA